MSHFPVSPISFSNADIPIYLDTTHAQRATEADELPEDICPKCLASSKDQPIHCISVTPAPPPYNSITPQIPSQGRLSVPSLNVHTSGVWPPFNRPHRPARAFRPYEEGRPRVRFRQNAVSPTSPSISEHDFSNRCSGRIGLGIPAAPFQPDTSPVTPGTEEKAEHTERCENSSEGPFAATNLAQRIEQKLWKYSESRNVIKRWLMEIISWVVSALAMAGIVIVLIVYQRQPLPRWPFGLTVNAYISVLAKVASAALLLPVSEALGQLKWNWFKAKSEPEKSKKMWDFELFDNASRGPWGSFILLLRTRGRSLAALGAAVTLFALAMDPFFQQVVGFPEQWRVQSTDASLARATTYNVYTAGELKKDDTVVQEYDQSMSATAYHYFYDNGTSFLPGTNGKAGASIPLTCPNSKCTWSEYETLGICNRCIRNFDLLEYRCQSATLDWISTPTIAPDGSKWIYPNGTACGWWLKADDRILMTGYTTDKHTNYTGEVLLSRSQPLYDLNTRAPLPGYAAKLNDTRNPIAHFVVASNQDTQQIQLNSTPTAHECIITWCVKSLESTLSGGTYTENATHITYNRTLGLDPWHAAETFDNGVFVGVDFTYNENITIIGKNGYKYEVENTTHVNILGIFDDIFPSTYTIANTTDMAQASLNIQQYVVDNHRARILTYNPFLYDNITTHFDKMAADWTNIMRSAQGSIEMVQGASLDLVTVVIVRWEWLSLPLGLLGLTFIFLVATIVRSSLEQDVGVWKTSAIATLLYGLPDDMRKKLTSAKDHGTPRANAKRTKLKWLPGTGWRFSGASALSPSSLRARRTPPQSAFN